MMKTTITEQSSPSVKQEAEKREEKVLVLKLKEKPKPRVSWAEDTVDNEGMNRKKSNRKFGSI
jgi:hypothetical protein